MRSGPSAVAILVCGLSLLPQARSAENPAYLTVDGDVSTPLALSEADFRALPRSSTIVKEEGGNEHRFEGVDLTLLLLRAGTPLKSDLKGADVAKYLHAEGADGFAAVFSLPEFDAQIFLVADALDGTPLAAPSGPLQLVSPNEVRHSRWIKHIALLRIKTTHK
jgi:DMSO/TMAO reductase YedYZ molybdopterin-dependent catalytic subunit